VFGCSIGRWTAPPPPTPLRLRCGPSCRGVQRATLHRHFLTELTDAVASTPSVRCSTAEQRLLPMWALRRHKCASCLIMMTYSLLQLLALLMCDQSLWNSIRIPAWSPTGCMCALT
jgi:hypothetical protein